MHLWDRLRYAKSVLQPVYSKYAILYEDPSKPDEPVNIVSPDPNWLAAALKGDILPPVTAYIQDRETVAKQTPTHPYAEPVGAMTEEEAIEYLIMKDIEPSIWRDYTGNRVILKIVPIEAVPTDRTYRNAWRITQ